MIVTERLRLREWREEDASLLAAIHADPDVMQFLGRVKTPSEIGEIVKRLMRMSKAGEPAFWAAERIRDGALLGTVGLHRLGTEFPFGPALEVGWRLARKHWGQGYATEAARGALDYGFDCLAAPRIYAFTALANTRSEAVMQRLRMKKIDGGEFAHPDLPLSDPNSMHLLYVAEREA